MDNDISWIFHLDPRVVWAFRSFVVATFFFSWACCSFQFAEDGIHSWKTAAWVWLIAIVSLVVMIIVCVNTDWP
jgi:hypothetical protein